MKYLQLLLLLITGMIVTISCEKDTAPTPLLTSVNVVHAVLNTTAIKVNTTGSEINWLAYTDSIKLGAFKTYSIAAETDAPVTIVTTSDTTKPMFNASFYTAPGDTYTLFLTGQYPQADTVWVRDYISNYTDSAVGIRFINLSPNSGTVNINIKGSTKLEAAGLAYKQITAFATYPGKSTNGTYAFEVKDPVNNKVLATFNLNITRFHNHTLVIRGLKGETTGGNAFSVSSVNPY